MPQPSPGSTDAGIFAAECHLGRGDGRLQSGDIADSMRTAISVDLLLVNLQNLIQREEQRLYQVGSHSASFLKAVP